MNAKIVEIFKSIQGEGKYVGEQQVFVRFFECNMHCHWCDTPHSIGDTSRHFKEIDQDAFISSIDELSDGCSSVSLTDIDIIAMDIKIPSSTKCQAYLREHHDFLRIAKRKDVFIKTVITSTTGEEDIHQAIEIVADIDPNILFILQPNTYEMSNGVMKRTLALQDICLKRLNQVRVLPQVHKFMKLR